MSSHIHAGAESDDENELRLRAGLNSPKAQPSMTFDEDEVNEVAGADLHLSVGAETDDEDNVTPNTKARDEFGVNSPRHKVHIYH